MKPPKRKNIAYFISPHGFGHAARAAAIMDALYGIAPGIHFEIFTTVPDWFFKGSLTGNFQYHKLITDIGIVQKTPLKANIPETIRQLDNFLPYKHSIINELAETIINCGCCMTICDIAPMGIEVAGKAGIPSILVENFTWDWIYENYVNGNDGLLNHMKYMRKLFLSADYHIQTEPICCRSNADLTSFPVSRATRKSIQFIRDLLEIPQKMRMVMITMGGIQEEIRYHEKLAEIKEIFFIIPGSTIKTVRQGNLLQLSLHSDFYHPDLLNACDAIIGKVGYSTLSEIYYAGIPFGYIARKNFRESDSLVSYIKDHMPGTSIDESSFYSGDWLIKIPELLRMQRVKRNHISGASQVAEFIAGLFRRIIK